MADRVDWQTIRDAYDDEDVILILNSRVAGILSSLWHRLEYEATYRVNAYDFADWDYLQRILADGSSEIGHPMKLSELLPYIDEVESLLRALQSLGKSECCDVYERNDFTGGEQYTDTVIDGVGNVPQNVIDAGFASGTTDWTGYAVYKCLAGHLIVQDISRKLRQFAELADTAGDINIGLGLIAAVAAALIVAPAGILLTAFAVLGSFLTVSQIYDGLLGLAEDDLEEAADAIDSVEDELACLIYTSDGTDDAIDQLRTGLVELLGSVLGNLCMSFFTEDFIRAMLGGRYDTTDVAARISELGYSGSEYDCSDCLAPLGPDEFDASWTFDSDLGGFEDNASTEWLSSGGNPGGCFRMFNFGFFNEGDAKLDTADMALFGDLSGYSTFKVIRVRADIKYDLAGTQTGHARLVFGSPIYSETGLAQDVWNSIDWDEATINDAGGHSLSSIIWALRLGGSGSYPNVPANIWMDNVYIRIRCSS